VPFIHSHKQNEEIYYVISGSGKAIIDNEEVNLTHNKTSTHFKVTACQINNI